MSLRVLQVVLCVIIWSVLIGVGLFKLSPAAGSVSAPSVVGLINSDGTPTPMGQNKQELRSRYLIPNRFMADNFVPGYTKNWNRGRDYSRTQKRLVVAGAGKQKKINQLMNLLQDLSDGGEVAIQQVIKLIDLEMEIIKNLLHRNNARMIQDAVAKRDALLEISLPAAAEVYDMTLSLATSEKGKKEMITRTPFLRSMMERLEQYHLLIKNMRNTFKAVSR